MEIGLKIKELRKQTKLSQKEFALRVGVGLRFLRDLEQGKKAVRIDKLNQVLDFLGYHLDKAKNARILKKHIVNAEHLNTSSNYRKARVMLKDMEAGIIEETDKGYKFQYNDTFLKNGRAISVSLPLRPEPYESDVLFSYFEGLLPEGWYLKIVSSTLKIDESDSFGILLGTCKDCAGAVSIFPIE